MLRKPYSMISLRGLAFASSLSIRCDHHTQPSTSVQNLLDHSSLKEDCHCDCYCNLYYSRDNLSDLNNVGKFYGHWAACHSCNIGRVLPTELTFQLNLEFEPEREITKTAAGWGRRWSAWIPRCSLHDEKAECKDVISHRMHLHLPSCWRRSFWRFRIRVRDWGEKNAAWGRDRT